MDKFDRIREHLEAVLEVLKDTLAMVNAATGEEWYVRVGEQYIIPVSKK